MRELLAIEPALYTFVAAEGVEPTNNAAERATPCSDEPSWPMVRALAKSLGVDCTAVAGGVELDEMPSATEPIAEKAAPKKKPKEKK